jgi:hypothetical protein
MTKQIKPQERLIETTTDEKPVSGLKEFSIVPQDGFTEVTDDDTEDDKKKVVTAEFTYLGTFVKIFESLVPNIAYLPVVVYNKQTKKLLGVIVTSGELFSLECDILKSLSDLLNIDSDLLVLGNLLTIPVFTNEFLENNDFKNMNELRYKVYTLIKAVSDVDSCINITYIKTFFGYK